MRIAVAVVLVAAFAVPASASAVQRTSSAGAGIQTSRPETVAASGMQTATMLRERIATALRLRSAAFENTADRLRERIRSMEQLCDRIDEAGGETAQVRAQLRAANASLEEALRLEVRTANQFRNVPDSDDMRGAFRQARTTGEEAVTELRRTRTQLRTALQELKDVVTELKEG